MNDSYLMHYGVLGMKWGVRKDRPKYRVTWTDSDGKKKTASPLTNATLTRAMNKHHAYENTKSAYETAVKNKQVPRNEGLERYLEKQDAKVQKAFKTTGKLTKVEMALRSEATKQKMKDVAKHSAVVAGKVAVAATLGSIGMLAINEAQRVVEADKRNRIGQGVAQGIVDNAPIPHNVYGSQRIATDADIERSKDYWNEFQEAAAGDTKDRIEFMKKHHSKRSS